MKAETAGRQAVGVRPVADPAFVLCEARSGSTLLRFLLDAHPDLGCPPETNLPALCAHLAPVWSLIEGAAFPAPGAEALPVIEEKAAEGIRRTMDLMIGSYLERAGKQRYCDKSLGTGRYADLLLRVYPQARFLCLYRHPMDVIASGIEACPWGLSGYGFDPYIAASPGNSVLALARYWLEHTSEILAVEERFAGQCLRVRYEDLVADPETVMGQVFGFLGVPALEGISSACFAAEPERAGIGDYKIWHTSGITASSVGRGWSIPPGLIPPPVMAPFNELAVKLGYLAVDETWGTTPPPGDVRMPGPGMVHAVASEDRDDAAEATAQMLGDRLRAGLACLDSSADRRWGQAAGEKFMLTVIPQGGRRCAYLQVTPAARAVTALTGLEHDSGDCQDCRSDWEIAGPADSWQQVLVGTTNMGVALRRSHLRYCRSGDSGPLEADRRVSMVADLLGITSWQPGRFRLLVAGGATGG